MPRNRDREKRLIVSRDGPACFYCGRPRHNPLVMTIEHLVARAHGGADALPNLRLADPLCNKFAGRRAVSDKLELRAKWHMADGL